jgi:hypothetical protein
MSEPQYPQGWQPPTWQPQSTPPAPAPKKHRKWPWVVGGVVALIVIISVAANGGGNSGTTTATAGDTSAEAVPAPVAAAPAETPVTVTVPTNLDGKTLGAATTALSNLGITQYSLTAAPSLQAAVDACQADVEKCTTLEVTSIDEAGQAVDPTSSVDITVKAIIPPGGANSITQDGTYVVGKDVKAGTWHTDGQSDLGCYWERDRNLDGDLDSIISNNNITGPTTVTVHSSDKAFQVTGGCTWTRE